MEEKPDFRIGRTQRDLSTIHPNECMLAAKWWASNMVTMPSSDPAKVHMLALPLAALLAPTPADLESWLRHAHAAVIGGRKGAQSIYQAARIELLLPNPPWLTLLNDSGVPALALHDQRWSREARIDEMGRLLDEIKEAQSLGNIALVAKS